MAVYHNLHSLPRFHDAVLTVGTFDGVHKGHKAILNEVAAHAAAAGGESVLITFDPHPRKLLFPHQPLGIITPLAQKLQLIQEAGIAHVVVIPFTREFANCSVKDYIEKILVNLIHPKSIVLGYDHRFGHDRLGNIDTLKHYAQKHNYELIEIPAQLIDEAAVSSTRIRKAIKDGRMEEVAHMLGRQYPVKGTVVHGRKLGRTIGYPTVNLEPLDAEQIIPAMGIYAIQAIHNAQLYNGMLSIGFNPTVTDKKELKIEANLFDFDQEIYGDEIEIAFVKKLRDERKFDSLESLRRQLHADKQDSLKVLHELT
ncbi:MAG: bifunctional riboflavin kinase/FAD synthetase [Taibaiella sp.]|nr:bifunctional riboflavin kinase/FAD synthetase [Taibaiella sp.]